MIGLGRRLVLTAGALALLAALSLAWPRAHETPEAASRAALDQVGRRALGGLVGRLSGQVAVFGHGELAPAMLARWTEGGAPPARLPAFGPRPAEAPGDVLCFVRATSGAAPLRLQLYHLARRTDVAGYRLLHREGPPFPDRDALLAWLAAGAPGPLPPAVDVLAGAPTEATVAGFAIAAHGPRAGRRLSLRLALALPLADAVAPPARAFQATVRVAPR